LFLTVHVSVCLLLFLLALISRGRTKLAVGRFGAQVDKYPIEQRDTVNAACHLGLQQRLLTESIKLSQSTHNVTHNQLVQAYTCNKKGNGSPYSITDCYPTCLQCFDAVGWAAGRASGL